MFGFSAVACLEIISTQSPHDATTITSVAWEGIRDLRFVHDSPLLLDILYTSAAKNNFLSDTIVTNFITSRFRSGGFKPVAITNFHASRVLSLMY
ncbi:hypothetical protein SeMB42_g01647 [Synchytrium endobioticum]|uniref:Uncharacterized protein n=1 Tax=Synchytrium endobioticum TaxID=286115 RepID=A0A507DKY1_9FUNG|nr:hypothetical protein SeMB42_g01647 [Synchytrium endobioticum]